jgi:hypothetical protein
MQVIKATVSILSEINGDEALKSIELLKKMSKKIEIVFGGLVKGYIY